ncbi:protein FAM96B [Metschnikowia bicuspidata]|uniref:Protein FAM96B n=1 Tax=Metschnikowia bicuspidata TaxID=27322 RepID=A0A4P9ZBA5_9ASCO|nr:protein FAM96B [Metschnikowia bicuspidata]
MSDLINANPTVIGVSALPTRLNVKADENTSHQQLLDRILSLSLSTAEELKQLQLTDELNLEEDDDDEEEDIIDEQEIFDLISTISDPEHPLTLAQLAVVNLPDITITHGKTKKELSEILIKITPTITHCSLATLIGLGIRVRLERSLPPRFRFRILIKEGTHQSENQVNKQLNDKERVAAACENDQLLSVVLQMLSTCV